MQKYIDIILGLRALKINYVIGFYFQICTKYFVLLFFVII